MVFNDDILFIHVGKTGGMSATQYLCSVLPSPVYNVVPKAAMNQHYGRATMVEGIRHETLREALKITERYGKGLNDFKAIYATLRNPYDQELSLFYYLKKKLRRGEKVHPKRTELVNKGLREFVKHGGYHRPKVKFEDYIQLGDSVPDNLRLLRFENLSADFLKVSDEYGMTNDLEFPYRNFSKRESKVEELSQELKDAIYRKHLWVFDNGYYER